MFGWTLVAAAWAAPQGELGAAVRTPVPAVAYEDSLLEGGATPAFGLDAGVLPWVGPVALRLGASVEVWHARWTSTLGDTTYGGGVDARGEVRVALRLATARTDRIVGPVAAPRAAPADRYDYGAAGPGGPVGRSNPLS